MTRSARAGRRALTGTRVRQTEKRVVIVQEYVPEYRSAFFTCLAKELADQGVDLKVIAGRPRATQAARGDAVAGGRGIVLVPSRSLEMFDRSIAWKRVGSLVRDAHLVIVHQEIRNVETYSLLLRQLLPGAPSVAMWGHGRNYVKGQSAAEERLKEWLTRRARWFFAYTAGGAEAVVQRGFSRDRVTVVQNSLDQEELRRLRRTVTDAEAQAVRASLRLGTTDTCVFIGALDPSKRLDFLLAACRRIARELPEFTLVIAGDGPERRRVEERVRREPWLRLAGRASARQKVLLAEISRLMLMPGRVGLIAVDSFALETPIVTTAWPWHAPEFEYLRPGENSVVTDDDVEAFAYEVIRALRDPGLVLRLRTGCRGDAERYSLSAMVANFAGGIQSALRVSGGDALRNRISDRN